MADKMGTLRRTHYSKDITTAVIGQEITVAGFIAKNRNLGSVIFADLKDNFGIIQLAFGAATDRKIFEKAADLHAEYVVMAQGTLRQRESINKNIPTGEVELFVSDLRILSAAETPPFETNDNINVNDELRLRYRYLDLRRISLHNYINMRSKVAAAVRNFYISNDFVEIETPLLIKSTPEGARDYLVPSRVQPGRFYALPQSPQLYKQILMLSGFDKYFQIAKCFRDEDLRADRQPEFTQIDLEMAFVDEMDIQTNSEQMISSVFKEILNVDLPTPFPRMTYDQAMCRYGSDKPDTRFDIELCNISDIVATSEFAVFASAIKEGGSVRCINAKGLADKLSRKAIDRLTSTAKTYGAKGLAYLRITGDGETSSYEKFLKDDEKNAIRTKANVENGDVLLVVGDTKNDVVFAALGALRLEIAKTNNLIPENLYNFLWVTDFPLFEIDEEANRLVAKHHPFTMPKDEDMALLDTDPAKCRAKAYDIVVNGYELGGGSIRINDPQLQARMFKILGFTEERARNSFGFLMDAYRYGAPPHGGLAFGFDRLMMILLNRESIRDVIAFPKVQNAGEVMSGSPDIVDIKQLDELSIASTIEPK